MQPGLTRSEKLLATFACLLLSLLILIDVLEDVRSGSTLRHVLVEVAALILSAVSLLALWLRTAWTSRERLRESERNLVRLRIESGRWREEAQHLLKGLGETIEQQFVRWGLTASEKEVALMLLKGLSLNEVAKQRGVSARTARQQSLAVYRKAGLSGRAELAAFFLEDLMLPMTMEDVK